MAKLKFSNTAQNLGAYQNYRSWLEKNQYRNICAYCIVDHDRLEIDHYEPQTMINTLGDHPENLLLSCSCCNGRAGKSDYHPKHKGRTRFKKANFKVINPRKDDYSKLFIVDKNGSIQPKNGRNKERAIQNILLLKLDRQYLAEVRKDYFNLLESAGQMQSLLKIQPRNAQARNCLNGILDKLNRIEIFFHVFGIKFNRTIKRSLAGYSRRPESI